MHGVRRARQSKEAEDARRQKEKAKLEDYLALTDNVMQRKKDKDYSRESFALTTRLLTSNPEFYTIWNFRRDILLNGIFSECSASEINDLLTNDLSLTIGLLRSHPKVYWIWNHRRWCLENVPNEPDDEAKVWKERNWTQELYFVEKMLDADARNFHAWAYRRYILASMPVKKPETDELAYTTKKIEASFSNFSAWHQRSKVLSSLWDQGKLDKASSKDYDFELVKQALYVDPYDQSSWIYHRWLVGSGDDESIVRREISVIEELSEIEPDCKWCLDSLVHYKRLLIQKHLKSDAHLRERQELIDFCCKTLERLRHIDPCRSQRYKELETQLEQKDVI